MQLKLKLLAKSKVVKAPLGMYYSSNLLRVLARRDKSTASRKIFDHFHQNVKSAKYALQQPLPTNESLEDKMVTREMF